MHWPVWRLQSRSSHAGVAGAGGAINLSKCREMCGAQTDSTQWIGWVGVVIAVLTLGSNYVPIKMFDTGDGKVLRLCCIIYRDMQAFISLNENFSTKNVLLYIADNSTGEALIMSTVFSCML